MIAFTYLEPTHIEETLDLLARYGDEAKLIAGGTGLVNLLKQRLVQPTYLIGLRRISGLNEVQQDNALHIGALCTHRMLETSALVRGHAPLLTETFPHVASIRIRTVATLGGTLAHADPNQDPPPALLALDAQVQLRSQQRTRVIALSDFFTGYYETMLTPDEIITGIIIPPQPAGSSTAFLKFLPQTHDDYATVAVAVRVTMDSGRIVDARVALGASAPTPIRAHAVENALCGAVPTPTLFRDAAALAKDVVDPTSDLRGSAAYKRDMAGIFIQRALTQAVGRTGKN